MSRYVLATVVLCGLGAGARADVRMPDIFSDNMVLQCDGQPQHDASGADKPMLVPIWGQADEGEAVTVEVSGSTASSRPIGQKQSTVAKDGKWMVRLQPLPGGGPYELTITGRNQVTIHNVLAGEVWLASGQSNMRFTMSRVLDAEKEIARSGNPQIRYYQVLTKKWVACTPATVGEFSGVAYYFAQALQRHLNRPVGIVENSVSGAVAQAFTSQDAFGADPTLAEMVKRHGEECSQIFDAQFAPIIPYAIRGAIWYQGEGNRDYPVTYRRLMPAMIADWRTRWGQGDFPFLIGQLANYQQRRDEPWEGRDCVIREVQLKTAQEVKNAGLVVAIDCGIEKNVHYPNKRPVGERFALAARALAYGEKIEYSGPIFESARFDGGKAIVSFRHVGGGLVAQGGPATTSPATASTELKGFLLCGEDHVFVRAMGRIEGQTVVVSSQKVPSPVAVRYAWERNPDCNLYNKDGLPASPFRSDEFQNEYTRDGNKPARTATK